MTTSPCRTLRRPEEVTAAWLQRALTQVGAPPTPVRRVRILEQASDRGIVSDIAVLAVEYGVAAGDLPDRLFLKIAKEGLHEELQRAAGREVHFFTRVAPRHPELPIPRCFDVCQEAASGRAHLLLEDLSESHLQRPFPLPSSLPHAERLVESLAAVHATWWGRPTLRADLGEPFDPVALERARRRLQVTFPHFIDELHDSLLPEQQETYERILGSSFLDRWAIRRRDDPALTLVHGDVHSQNVMFPRDPHTGRAILIDWQLWEVNLATTDLAFFMAHKWSPQRRARLEMPLLRRYHDALVARGVHGYGWRDLLADYRAAVTLTPLIAIGQFRRGLSPATIWYGIEHSLAAFQDLDCTALLDGA